MRRDDGTGESHLEIAHVLFTDIVGYSKLLSDKQRELVRLLNQIVSATNQFQRAESAGKLLRLPTGDGMALAFFASPDAPVRCARELSRKACEYPTLRLRMGINSGPVDEVIDVNGRRNVTGAGINLAQRVMDCGDAGHILVSRRVADDLAQYTEWQPYLHQLGEVEVKHGMHVDVANFYGEDFGNSAVPDKITRAAEEHAMAAAQAARLRRQRIIVWSASALFLLLCILMGSWAWQRRAGLTSAYKPGAAGIVEKSIAVLPFDNFDDKENAYLADGVQDEILTDLTKVADLKVISRRSVAQYRDTKQTTREIGKALQVAHVLEGSVQKVAGRIHVTAQLIDTRNEAQIWAEKYDREIADVFQIQSDISQAIVNQLKLALSPAERAAIEEKPTQDKEAYDLYMQARRLIYEGFGILATQGEKNAAKAVTLLESAIARDRNFALAYCALADAHFTLNEKDKAKQAIDNALRISPALGDAHLLQARYLFDEDRKTPAPECWTAGEKELAIAAAALPGRVEIFDLRADMEEDQGKWKQALADREKAAQLDPRDGYILRALVELYITLRRYDQAERLLDHVIQITPQESTGPFWRQKCSIALARGDTKAAMAALDSSPVRNTASRFLNYAVARVLLLQREYQKADEIHQTVEDTAKANKIVPKSVTPIEELFVRSEALVNRARIAHYRGESDKARQLFEAARPGFEKCLSSDNADSVPFRWVHSHSMMYLAEIDAAFGRKADALRQGRQALELWPLKGGALLGAELAASLAIVYLSAGEREAALQQLSEAAKLPASGAATGPTVVGLSAGDLKLNPLWDELRNDPLFDKIIAEAAKPIKLD